LQTPLIEYTDGDDAMTIADGGAVTFGQEAQFSSGIQTAGSIETATIDYTDGDLAITIADGGAITTSGNATVSGNATITGDLTITGNDATFGNGESISNATDGDFLFTTDIISGALTLKNSNGENGNAAIELVSDNGTDLGDAYEVKSLNGNFTITSDNTTNGTYDDTHFTIAGNTDPALSTTTIAGGAIVAGTGGLDISGGIVTLANDETISNAADGIIAITAPTTSVSGDLSVGTSLQTATIDYTNGDLAMTIADGGGVTVAQDATFSGSVQGFRQQDP
jgi:hypothetical protein